mmetsp:Transcript_4072/g.11049  ORF Transcript_4072/g.11049 Transcript_4072/m.11049 type:complete len:366 (-) Transcript_4072:212-1309(-)
MDHPQVRGQEALDLVAAHLAREEDAPEDPQERGLPLCPAAHEEHQAALVYAQRPLHLQRLAGGPLQKLLPPVAFGLDLELDRQNVHLVAVERGSLRTSLRTRLPQFLPIHDRLLVVLVVPQLALGEVGFLVEQERETPQAGQGPADLQGVPVDRSPGCSGALKQLDVRQEEAQRELTLHHCLARYQHVACHQTNLEPPGKVHVVQGHLRHFPQLGGRRADPVLIRLHDRAALVVVHKEGQILLRLAHLLHEMVLRLGGVSQAAGDHLSPQRDEDAEPQRHHQEGRGALHVHRGLEDDRRDDLVHHRGEELADRVCKRDGGHEAVFDEDGRVSRDRHDEVARRELGAGIVFEVQIVLKQVRLQGEP